jgi:hypothetical protein
MFKKIKEKFSKIKPKKLAFFCLLAIACRVFFIYFDSWRRITIQLPENLDNKTSPHIEQKVIFELEEKIKILENKIDFNRLQIDNLSLELTKLQNQNPEKNINNIKILTTVFEIAEKINNNEDFMDKYEFLKALSSTKNSIFELVIKMGDYLKYNAVDIEKTYFEEYGKFTKNDNIKNKSKIRRFLDDNIIIRKIDNFDTEKDDKIDIILHNLSDSLKNKKYTEAINIIDDNEWGDYFSKTKKAVAQRTELKKLTESILLAIYKEY